MKKYLASTDIIDWKHPEIVRLARQLAEGEPGSVAVAKKCFEWVRDEIRHSHDYQLNPVTCAASEVLEEKTGFCYAKSHLLAALLRANLVPAGLCYQRLSRNDNGAPYCLHGLNAVWLPDRGWYRVDPRGNKEGINAAFDPPVERLAYLAKLEGEADIPLVFPEPLEVVVQALRSHDHWQEMHDNLPDMDLY